MSRHNLPETLTPSASSAVHRLSRLARIARHLIALFILFGCVLGRVPPLPTSTPQTEQLATITPGATELPGPMVTPSEVVTPDGIDTVDDKLTQFGMLTVLPESSGATFTPAAIAATAESGVRYMRVALDWAISEPEPGQILFNSRNDQIIQNIEQTGLRVLPTVYVGRGWMNNNPPGRQEGGSRSYPPIDLTSQSDDRYGYSPSYYNFVYSFFSHYRGHFEYVAIENEANSKLFWGGTADEYVRLLRTAHMAIKAADPDVRIADSGFVSTAVGSCLMDDYLTNGLMTSDEILLFASYYSNARGGTTIDTIEQLQKVLSRPQIKEQCERINYMLDNMGGAIDVINFHFYEDYRALPTIVAWLRARTSAAGYNPGVMSNEMGTRNQGDAYAQSPDHAKEVFKKMLTAISLRMQVVVWFSADTVQAGKDKVGLFDDSGQLRPAGNTLKLVIKTLDSNYHFKEALSSGPLAYQYVFEDSQGKRSLDTIWVEGGQQFPRIDAPAGAQQAVVMDNLGETVTAPIENGQIELMYVNTPLFVIWEY